MTAHRRHLLVQAALCYVQAGWPAEAARCRDLAGEPVAAAELYRQAGDLVKAAGCYRRAGLVEEAADCLIALGRPAAAADLWAEAGRPLEAGWLMAVDASQPQRARGLLATADPAGSGEELRLGLALAVCEAVKSRPGRVATVLRSIEERLSSVTPASEQARLVRWAVRAADHVTRPDLAAMMFAAAYRCRLRGTTERWREWARTAIGGTAGIPDEVR